MDVAMTSRIALAVLPALGLFFVAFQPTPAAALALQPYQCTPCNANNTAWDTVYPFQFQSDEGIDGADSEDDGLPAFDPPLSSKIYANYINDLRKFWANGRVKKVQFRAVSFNTVLAEDVLSFSQSTSGATLYLSGNLTGLPKFFRPSTSFLLNARPILINFRSDDAVGLAGFRFEQVQVCCDNSVTPAFPQEPIAWGERNSGVLMATGDVVYFSIPGAVSGEKINLILWGTTGSLESYQDIDLKVRCGAWPTENQFDFIAASAGPEEFLTIPSNAPTCPTGWRVAVYQYSGAAGPFHLVASRIKTQRILSVRAGFEYSPTITEKNNLADTLVQASKYYYSYTEGQHFVQDIKVYGSAGSNCASGCGGLACDICIKAPSWPGPSVSGICTGTIKIWNGHKGAPGLIAHEWGHRYFCVHDEYSPSTGASGCAYSQMSLGDTVALGNYNFCYDEGPASDQHNHAEDGDYATGHPAAWDVPFASALITVRPTRSPDNFLFVRHDFNAHILSQVF